MNARTHILGGVATASCCMYLATKGYIPASMNGSVEQLLSVPLCMTGALLPDIDLPNSRLGMNIKPVSWLANKFFGHRTFFHSPMFLFLIWFLTKVLNPQYLWIAESLVVGGASHLLLDMFNKAGIPLFWPAKHHISMGSVKLDGGGETLIDISLLLISLVAIGKCAFSTVL